MATADLGLVGLAVMGRNLALNLADHGYRVRVYNRTHSRTRDFLEGEAAGRPIEGAQDPGALAAGLARPRVVLLMVQAGPPVDAVIAQLLPHLEPGDVLVDGGNSRYQETERRVRELGEQGLHFIGMGVSGGEAGARHGPALMPGGDPEGWPRVREMFQAVAARVDGVPCCQWMGEGGAGHYVKMVHNGIEYGDMQLIAEAFQLLRQGLALDLERVAGLFREWNHGPLASYLVEITGEILAVREADGTPLVDRILDSAGQKGTGRWTAIDALGLGVPLTLIGEAVNARFLSALKEERREAARRLRSTGPVPRVDAQRYVRHVHDALYASRLVSYAQGFMLLRAAAEVHHWRLAFGDIALVWRGGCIIRSRFLDEIHAAFELNPGLRNLLLDDFFAEAVGAAEPGWRRALVLGVEAGIPLPATAAALSFLDGYRSETLPANLLQAQRDYFGAHGYQRVDRPPGERFHFDWAGDHQEHRVDA